MIRLWEAPPGEPFVRLPGGRLHVRRVPPIGGASFEAVSNTTRKKYINSQLDL